jgi:hypothetical protein
MRTDSRVTPATRGATTSYVQTFERKRRLCVIRAKYMSFMKFANLPTESASMFRPLVKIIWRFHNSFIPQMCHAHEGHWFVRALQVSFLLERTEVFKENSIFHLLSSATSHVWWYLSSTRYWPFSLPLWRATRVWVCVCVCVQWPQERTDGDTVRGEGKNMGRTTVMGDETRFAVSMAHPSSASSNQ